MHECLPLVLAHTGVSMRTLTVQDVDGFEADLHASAAVSASSRRAYQARLFGLRQLLFEARVIDTPPSATDRGQLRRPARGGGRAGDRPRHAALSGGSFSSATARHVVQPV